MRVVTTQEVKVVSKHAITAEGEGMKKDIGVGQWGWHIRRHSSSRGKGKRQRGKVHRGGERDDSKGSKILGSGNTKMLRPIRWRQRA